MPTVFEKLRGSDQSRYADDRHPDLPWGYWLVSSGDSGRPPLIDENGRKWNSVREAFWSGRLGLPYHSRSADQTLEFMASYMAICDGRFVAPEERVSDIFQGDRHVCELYVTFLDTAGLVDARNDRLTPECGFRRSRACIPI